MISFPNKTKSALFMALLATSAFSPMSHAMDNERRNEQRAERRGERTGESNRPRQNHERLEGYQPRTQTAPQAYQPREPREPREAREPRDTRDVRQTRTPIEPSPIPNSDQNRGNDPSSNPRRRPIDDSSSRPRDTDSRNTSDRRHDEPRPRPNGHNEDRYDRRDRRSNDHNSHNRSHEDRRYDRSDRRYHHTPPPRISVHSHRHFRSYSGIRIGFYFAPSHGYYRVPDNYYQVRYHRGGYLPSFFLRYRLHNPNDYGLSPAPYGMTYVWVDNCIVLVDLYNYEIVEIFYNIY